MKMNKILFFFPPHLIPFYSSHHSCLIYSFFYSSSSTLNMIQPTITPNAHIRKRDYKTGRKYKEIDDDGLWSTIKIYINSFPHFLSIIFFNVDVSVWRSLKRGHIKLSYILFMLLLRVIFSNNCEYSHKQTNVVDDVAQWSILQAYHQE